MRQSRIEPLQLLLDMLWSWLVSRLKIHLACKFLPWDLRDSHIPMIRVNGLPRGSLGCKESWKLWPGWLQAEHQAA